MKVKRMLKVIFAYFVLGALSLNFIACKKGTSTSLSSQNSSLENSAEHKHIWGDGEITKMVECEADGEKTYTCECGEIKVEKISAIGHNYENGVCLICKNSQSNSELQYVLINIIL